MKKGLYLVIGGFFSALIFGLYVYRINVLADELKQKADYILRVNDGFISLLEEDTEDRNQILSDSIRTIASNEDENMEDYTETYTDYQDGNDVVQDQVQDQQTLENSFRIMVVFCFGLVAGVIVGHFLTGFIK